MGGSYLSRPVKETVSELKSNDKLSYGASSMQGWRVRQEDAHNCILDFDDDVSFFAVYDGHGGSEVAVYTSQELPKFLKTTDKYKGGLYQEALVDAFLGFDDTIPSQEVLDKLKDIRDRELLDSRAKSQERRSRLQSSVGDSIDEAEEEEDEEVEDDSEDDEEDEFESAEVLLREACQPVEQVVAAYKQGTSVCSSSDGAGCSSSSAGSSSSFLGECSSSFVDSGVGSSSAGSSSAAGCSSAGSSSSRSSSSECDAAGSSQSPSKSAASSSKSSKDENLANGSVSEAAVMNGVLSNGDLTDELKEETLPKRIPKGPAITINDEPGTSPKKKKLALSDLDDSTVVKNFISKDEISESDEDDSEDETFELSNDFDNDEGNDDDDDDDDDEDDEDDSDSDAPKTGFVLNRNTLVQQLTKHLRRNHGIIVHDSDDSDDDADESVGEEDESANEAKSGEEEEDEDSMEEEEEEEDSDNDEEGIDIFTDGEQPGVDSGCTAVVALIKGDKLYVANAGDSRCVLCKNGSAVEMSEDHKPEDELECARVEKAGGRVSGGRVDGGLNLSRAIGDHRYKKNTELPNTEQMITALPDVRVAKLEPDVEFIVLACDGIWNSLSSQDVVNFIRPRIKAGKTLSEICEELFHECLAPNTMCDGTGCDNMTCIIVKPHHGAPANDAASNVADSESQVSNSVDSASSAAEKDAPSDAHSTEPAPSAAPENHQTDAPLPETTTGSVDADAPMEEGVSSSRNLKRPNDSSDDVPPKRCKTDDVSVDDSSCVDTTTSV